jgi:hypothetical protein
MASDAKLLLYSKRLATGWFLWGMAMTDILFTHQSEIKSTNWEQNDFTVNPIDHEERWSRS